LKVLRQNVRIASGFKPLSEARMRRLRKAAAAYAADGRFELYKTTAEHDGDEGRAQHDFPPPDELAR
jgi:hypothetical protein